MAFDTNHSDPTFPGFHFPLPAPRTRKPRAAKKAKRKAPNYAGRNQPKTDRLHRVIAQLLHESDGMTLSELGRALGMSRQLMRYHVLKMVAHRRLIVLLEPCEGNGGVQYRVWEKAAHARDAVKWLHEHAGVAA
jgi:hypothetical protein